MCVIEVVYSSKHVRSLGHLARSRREVRYGHGWEKDIRSVYFCSVLCCTIVQPHLSSGALYIFGISSVVSEAFHSVLVSLSRDLLCMDSLYIIWHSSPLFSEHYNSLYKYCDFWSGASISLGVRIGGVGEVDRGMGLYTYGSVFFFTSITISTPRHQVLSA